MSEKLRTIIGSCIIMFVTVIAIFTIATMNKPEPQPVEVVEFEVSDEEYVEPEPEKEAVEEEAYEEEQSYYYAPSYDYPSDGLTPYGGVNYYDGRKETYYSSNVLYHYRTGEWWLDDEGFYRTDEGYYVVAASDMEQGITFEGSKGTCIVLDSGCANGTTDYYVGW